MVVGAGVVPYEPCCARPHGRRQQQSGVALEPAGGTGASVSKVDGEEVAAGMDHDAVNRLASREAALEPAAVAPCEHAQPVASGQKHLTSASKGVARCKGGLGEGGS